MADTAPSENPAVVAALVENHRRFLAFIERRVGSRAEAEDILQSAFVRGIRRSGTVKDPQSSVAWFYRLLRNALTDHYRRAAAESRRLAGEPEEGHGAYEPELRGEVCACIGRLLPALKPEYAQMIRRVDLEEEPLARVAGDLGITPNNAAVAKRRRARSGLAKFQNRPSALPRCSANSAPPVGTCRLARGRKSTRAVVSRR